MPLYDRDYMRPDSAPRPQPWFVRWTPLHWIIAVNVVVFCLQHLGFDVWVRKIDGQIIEDGGVSIEALVSGKVWTMFTYMFVHEGPMHLIGNLLLIGFVGSRVQALLGARPFLLIYFLSGLVGAAAQLAVEAYVRHDMTTPIVGASACAFGLMMALASLLPEERVTTMLYFIIPVTARLWTLAMVMVGAELVFGISSVFSTWAHEAWGQLAYFAHLGGAFAGWYFVRLLGYGGRPMTYERLWRERRATKRPKVKREVARVRRERAAPLMDEEAVRRQRAEPGRREHPVMEEINEILDKINREGLGSLSEDERRVLDRASREIARKEGRSTEP
jgi:membrane associated rhomboid family serine protease